MPDGVAIRSLLWSTIRFPEPEIEVHKNSQLRREGILALSETVVERTIPMVARKRSGEPDAGGTSTAVAVGGWRSGNGPRCGGVAARCGEEIISTSEKCVSGCKMCTERPL